MKERDYTDILELPRPVSDRHAPMSRRDRAAQFSPFAALTGYDGVIRETGRLTGQRRELTEARREELDRILREAIDRERPVTLTLFCPDAYKSGGSYQEKTGYIKKTDPAEGILVLEDGTVVPIQQIDDISFDAPK